MAHGSTAMLRRAGITPLSTLRVPVRPAEHFQQCGEFLPLSNRGLGPLAVTVLTSAIEGEAEILCSI